MYEFYSVHEKVGVWIKAVPRPAGQIRRLNRALERPTRIPVIVIAFLFVITLTFFFARPV